MNRLRFLFVISAICVLRGIAQPLLAKGDTFIVVIDAGHGGKDPGAKGVKTNEKTINLAVALKLGKMIAAGHDNVQVIYTRVSAGAAEDDAVVGGLPGAIGWGII